jgi:N-acetylmuramoyl-L-alanine amidase
VTTLASSLHFRTRRDFVDASVGGERILMNVRRPLLVAIATVVIAALVAAPATTLAVTPVVSSFSVTGSPFAESFAPLPTNATLSATLSRRARVTVTIRRPNGTLVRRLATKVRRYAGTSTWTWDGRNDAGGKAADGRYMARIVAVTGLGTERVNRPLRKGLPMIYTANPGALVIAVDPGHGGRFSGAVNGSYMEKDFNLAIALKLQALLERAGVRVVMTRTTDVAVNRPASDENGDGILDRYDDDLMRSDIANEAGADIAVHVHNNAASNTNARGTEAYTDAHRTWTPQGLDLAADLLSGVAGTLESYRSSTFQPKNAGVHTGWYYYMGPYDPPFLIRAALMTSVLSESLFVSNPSELEALKRPDIQLAIASGIYLGVASYLNSRDFGIGYELVAGPQTVTAGQSAAYTIRVTNRGNATSDGWTLSLASVPAVPEYDGSGAHGTQIGAVAIPDGVAPGQSIELSVNASAPVDAGDWLVKTDVLLPGGGSLDDSGIAPLQVRLTTTAP